VRHVDYLVERMGIDSVAFGSDFEGAIVPAELGGVAGLPKLVAALRERYSDEDVDKITYGNWLRVLDTTWRPWRRFFEVAGDDPRETLLDAVARFDEPGFAVDLGCGTGRDCVELLRRGWRVLAIDREAEAIERLLARGDVDGARLETKLARFEDATWPACDLVSSSFALPFCTAGAFDGVWTRIVDSLRPGGRFAGQLFGAHDDWAGTGVATHTREQVGELLQPFEIERLDEIDRDGQTATGRHKHWHVFHVVARKR
jgi:SAM-dependent methyltransferase